MKSKTLTLTTRFNQNKPVTLADLVIFSKRLNGEEEMELQEIQLEATAAKPEDILNREVDYVLELLRFRATNDTMRAKLDSTKENNYQGRNFVLDNVGKYTSVKLLNYLRNGIGLAPGETLTLPVFKDPSDPSDLGVLVIEDRAFVMRALNYREALYAIEQQDTVSALQLAKDAQGMIDRASGVTSKAGLSAEGQGQELVTEEQVSAAAEAAEPGLNESTPLTEQEIQAQLDSIISEGKEMLERARELTRMSAQVCATYLNARLLLPPAPAEQAAAGSAETLEAHIARQLSEQGYEMSGTPIDGAWLLQHLQESDIGKIISFLADGEIDAEDSEEGEEGNAQSTSVSA